MPPSGAAAWSRRCSSTWTTSSASTIRSATAPATRCFARSPSRALTRLARDLMPYRWRVAGALVALVVAAGCWLALGQGVKHVVDSGFASGEPHLLDQALAGLIGIAVALAAATWFRFYLMMTLGERVV